VLYHENHSPQDPDVGTARSINFLRFHRATTFDDRAQRFRLYQHPPVLAGRPCTTGGKGIGEVLCLGTLNTLCLKRRGPVDRSNSCCLSSSSLFLYNSSFVDLKVRVILSFFRCMSFITRSSNVLV